MERVQLELLKRRLAQVISAVETGESILVTRHNQVVARIVPPEPHLHIGSRFGSASVSAALEGLSCGRYLDGIDDDRRSCVDGE